MKVDLRVTQLEKKRRPEPAPDVNIIWRGDDDPAPVPSADHLVLRWPAEPQPARSHDTSGASVLVTEC